MDEGKYKDSCPQKIMKAAMIYKELEAYKKALPALANLLEW